MEHFKSALKEFNRLDLDDYEKDHILGALEGADPTINLVNMCRDYGDFLATLDDTYMSEQQIIHLGNDLMNQKVPDPETIALLMLIDPYLQEEGVIDCNCVDWKGINISDVWDNLDETLKDDIINWYPNDYEEDFDINNVNDIDYLISYATHAWQDNDSEYCFYENYNAVYEVIKAVIAAVSKYPNKAQIFQNIKDSFSHVVFVADDKFDSANAHYNDDYESKKNYKTSGRFMNDDVKCKVGGRNAVEGGYDKLESLDIKAMFKNDRNKPCQDIFGKISVGHNTINEIERNTTRHGLDYISYAISSNNECPVCVFIYHDGKSYRGYIPIHGNAVNTITKAPFGCYGRLANNADIEYLVKHNFIKPGSTEFGDDIVAFNYTECLKDFESRVVVNGISLPYSNEGEPDPNKGLDPISAEKESEPDYITAYSIGANGLNPVKLPNNAKKAKNLKNKIINIEYAVITKFDFFYSDDELEKIINKKERMMRVFHKSSQSEIDKEINKIKEAADVNRNIVLMFLFGDYDELKFIEPELSNYVKNNIADQYIIVPYEERSVYAYSMANPFLPIDEIEKKLLEFNDVNWTKADLDEKLPVEERRQALASI